MLIRPPMHATVVYNPSSGGAATEDELFEQLGSIGWNVDRCVPQEQLDDCICQGADVVVVAGGDGTVARVAKQLAGTTIPMAILPMGTANNVARSLGLGVEASSAVLALKRATERHFDLGVVRSRRKRDYFLECFGMGVFAYLMGEKANESDKKIHRALGFIADELERYQARVIELEVDGNDCSGTYVLAATLNAKSFGPALTLAPEARCDDGELDVVLVRPEEKRALVTHLRHAVAEGDIAFPAFETLRARCVRVRAPGQWAHVDETAHQLEAEVCVDAVAGAVKLLAPRQSPVRSAPADPVKRGCGELAAHEDPMGGRVEANRFKARL
jgi:diacylglycerol kinase (ATP)